MVLKGWKRPGPGAEVTVSARPGKEMSVFRSDLGRAVSDRVGIETPDAGRVPGAPGAPRTPRRTQTGPRRGAEVAAEGTQKSEL